MLGKLRATRTWVQTHPAAADAALAGALAAAAVVPLFSRPGPVRPVNAAVLAAGALALSWRRRFPVCTLGSAVLAYSLLRIGSYDTTVLALALLAAAYTVGDRAELRAGLTAVACCLPVYAALLTMDRPRAGIVSYAGVFTAFCGSWWIGRVRRVRRSYVRQLEERAVQLQRASAASARTVRRTPGSGNGSESPRQ